MTLVKAIHVCNILPFIKHYGNIYSLNEDI